MDQHHKYICYYCTKGYDMYSELITHLCSCHNTYEIKYREKELNEISGKIGYRTKIYQGLVPADSTLTVTDDHRISILNYERSKKKKTNTPIRTNEVKENELTYNSKKSLSDLLDNMDINTECNDKEDSESDQDLEYLITILPEVIGKLKEHGQIEIYRKWCTLVKDNKFPLDNICYLLFLDLVNWFDQPITSKMRYFRSETKKFWEVGYRLFRGKFIRFMSGPRNQGQLLDGSMSKGKCTPTASKINFAVPSVQTLTQDKLAPIFPGIIEETIQSISNSLKSKVVKLGIDGKKISRGKGNKMGDIDCWGFETRPTLQERKDRLQSELEKLTEVFHIVEKFDQCTQHIPLTGKELIWSKLVSVIKDVGMRIKDLRELLLRLNFGIQKFLKFGESSGDWRKSRYAPVISTLKVGKYDTEQAIDKGLDIVKELGLWCAALSGTREQYSTSGQVDMEEQINYHELRSDYKTDNPRYTKQRSAEWFEFRNQSIVTGSTCNKALGLARLKDQQAHFSKVIQGIADNAETISEETRKNMEYGTKHEIDGIATMVSRIIPALFPGLQYYEEGCVRMSLNENPSFFVVSPDGMFSTSIDNTPTFMYENKCRVKNPFATDVYYSIPKYYIPQVLCEMKAYNCKALLFSCWSEKSTVIFKVKFDDHLWNEMVAELKNVYCSPLRKKPTKFSDSLPILKSLIDQFAVTNVTFLAEFPSCIAVEQRKIDTSNGVESTNPYQNMQQADLKDSVVEAGKILNVLHATKKWINEAHELCRTVATEILVFMVNDHDRLYHEETNNAYVVAYAMKGPSMSNEIFRKMVNYVIQECEKYGLLVQTTSSDGQWHKYGIRDGNDKPLTIIQLQKDFWTLQKKRPKSVILKELRERYKVKSLTDIRIEKGQLSPIIVHGHCKDSYLHIFKRDKPLSYQTKPQSKETNDIDERTISTNESNTECLNGFVPDSFFNEDDMRDIDNILSATSIMFQQQMTTDEPVDNDYNLSDLYETEMHNLPKTNDFIGNIATTVSRNVHVSPAEHFNDSSSINQHHEQMDSSSINQHHEQMDVSAVIGNAYHELYDLSVGEEMTQLNTAQDWYTFLDEYDATGGNMSLDNVFPTAAENLETNVNVSENQLDATTGRENEYEVMLSALKSESNASKWNSKTTVEFKISLGTMESACKALTKKELMICINSIMSLRDTESKSKVGSSWNKAKLYSTLSSLMTGESLEKTSNRKRRSNPPKLIQLTSRRINAIPKEILCIILCEEKWPEYYKEWTKTSPLAMNVSIPNVTESYSMFSQPSIDSNDTIRCHFTDCCHILTCLRTKICTTGLTGLRKEAWIKAAKSEETQLNIAIVVECIDKQSVAFAKRLFGEDVEIFMMNNGFEKEAAFVHFIRKWFESEDEPGMDATERCVRRVELRQYLLKDVNFGRFPPLTQYVKGIPIVTFESLLTNIDRKLQLFKLLPRGSYNVRALGSQEVEQFFITMRDLDPSGLGTPKPDDIPAMIATATLLDNTRMNPSRLFYMKTTRAAIYPEADFHLFQDPTTENIPENSTVITVHNNFFDQRNRKRTQAKRKSGQISLPDLPSNRVSGVRQYHKCDESKILAHQRKGMDDI